MSYIGFIGNIGALAGLEKPLSTVSTNNRVVRKVIETDLTQNINYDYNEL